MKWSKTIGKETGASSASKINPPVPDSGAGGARGSSGGDSGGGNSGGSGASGSGGVKPLNSSSTPDKTGNNLEAKPTGVKTTKVTFDIEKLKAAFPKFVRLLFKSLNNLLRLVSVIPRVPFKITFEDLSPEEEELFKEAAWPGFEAALPSAAKNHPIAFLMSAFFLLITGKINFQMKPKPEKPPVKPPEEKKKEEGQNGGS